MPFFMKNNYFTSKDGSILIWRDYMDRIRWQHVLFGYEGIYTVALDERAPDAIEWISTPEPHNSWEKVEDQVREAVVDYLFEAR